MYQKINEERRLKIAKASEDEHQDINEELRQRRSET
jgi:hypothetical protein